MANDKKTVESIRPIKKEAEKELLSRKGVTGVDIGYKIVGGKVTDELSIRVYVARKKIVTGKEKIPETIKGVKTDVIQLTFKPTALVRQFDVAPREDATRYDTLRGGMSIGPCRAIYMEPPDVEVAGNYIVVGTLGAIVADNGTGDRMMLTNFHVAAVNDTWSTGDAVAQPSRPDGGSCPADRVGTLERAVIAGTTAGGRAGVDGAVINISGRPTACEVIGIGDIEGTAVAAEGMAVRKRGRTTELTFGTIGSTDLTVSLSYGEGIGDITLEDQILIDVDETQSAVFGIGGDSGSVVINDDNRVVGLYFAGNLEEKDDAGNVILAEGVIGIANPIAAVESALNVRICRQVKLVEKKIEVKELEKVWLKEHIKEFKEFGPKELKEHIKEYKEPKEIYEDKRFEDKYFEKQWEKSFEGGGGLPNIPGLPGRGSTLDQRLARIEAAIGISAKAAPSAGSGFCEDFTSLGVQSFANPWSYQGAVLTILNHQGNLKPTADIRNMGSLLGLDAGYATKVEWPNPCTSLEVVLTHFSTPAVLRAFDSAGTLVGSASMSGASGSTETLAIHGSSVTRIVIEAPQNEVLIHRICCTACCVKPKPEKLKIEKIEKQEKLEIKEIKEKPEKLEIKEFKEKPEKREIKEWKEKNEKFEKPELKELKKEVKEPKELKEGFKDLKEPKEMKEIVEDKPLEKREEKMAEKGMETEPRLPGEASDLLQRLERIEAALCASGPGSHFIGKQLRPDLTMGALRKEPDAQALHGRARQLQKQAADGKQTKDNKDAGEKLPEGYF